MSKRKPNKSHMLEFKIMVAEMMRKENLSYRGGGTAI